MSVAMDTARRETSGWKVYLLAAYYLVVGNVALSVAGLGLLQLAMGFGLDLLVQQGTIGGGNSAIVAGYLGIWGVTLILVGLGTYAVLWANKVYGQVIYDEDAT